MAEEDKRSKKEAKMAKKGMKTQREKDDRAKEMGYESWEDWTREVAKQAGREVCGAWGKHKKAPCGGPIMAGGRCRYHGGASQRGVDHWNYQGKGFSKDIPTKLLKRFVEAVEDPEITSLVSHIALLDSRLGELLEKIETEESKARWDKINQLVEELEKELTKDDPDLDALRHKIINLRSYLEADKYEIEVWEHIEETIENRRKLSEAERRREEKLEANLSVRQTQTIISALQRAIEDEADKETQRRIAARMRNILYKEKKPPARETKKKLLDKEDD